MAECRVFSDQTNRFAVTRKAFPLLVSPAFNGKDEAAPADSKCAGRDIQCCKNAITADPIYVTEYSGEICDYFLVAEKSHCRDPNYMTNQPEITEKMRMILVDWLVDVVIKFKLHLESYYLAVDIVDRYLGAKVVSRGRLQLVGITAVLLAAKHEEIWPPGVKDCVFISANTYSAKEVFEMERDIAVTLRFKFTVPTVYPLACHFLGWGNSEQITRDATFFFLECSSHSYQMLEYLPSRVAAASVLLGRLLVAWNNCITRLHIEWNKIWDNEMVYITGGITLDELIGVAAQLLSFTMNLSAPSSKLQAARRKYLSPKYSNVASLEMPTLTMIFSS